MVLSDLTKYCRECYADFVASHAVKKERERIRTHVLVVWGKTIPGKPYNTSDIFPEIMEAFNEPQQQ